MTRARELADRLRTEFPGRFDEPYSQVFADMLMAGHGPDFGAVELPAADAADVADASGGAADPFRAIVELDLDYSPSSCVPDVGRYVEAYAAESARARAELDWTELAYGPDPMARIDFFPAGTGDGPLLIYIHGGYWQELSRAESAFMVPGLRAAGVNVGVLGYGLAPRLGLDAIVAMVREGVGFLAGKADELGFDGARVFLAGSSAGAHLAMMCLLDGFTGRGPQPRSRDNSHGRFRGGILLSGVYDLVPLVPTYINGAVGMDEATARRNSPLISPIVEPAPNLPRLTVARGSNEPRGFADQHELITSAIPAARAMVVRDRHHFDLPMDLGDPSTVLGRAVFDELIGER